MNWFPQGVYWVNVILIAHNLNKEKFLPNLSWFVFQVEKINLIHRNFSLEANFWKNDSNNNSKLQLFHALMLMFTLGNMSSAFLHVLSCTSVKLSNLLVNFFKSGFNEPMLWEITSWWYNCSINFILWTP